MVELGLGKAVHAVSTVPEKSRLGVTAFAGRGHKELKIVYKGLGSSQQCRILQAPGLSLLLFIIFITGFRCWCGVYM